MEFIPSDIYNILKLGSTFGRIRLHKEKKWKKLDDLEVLQKLKIYKVKSETIESLFYCVNLTERKCECSYFMWTGRDCKHIIACDMYCSFNDNYTHISSEITDEV